MELDVRDFSFWIHEARAKVLRRKMEAYSASLLPHQDNIQSQIDELNLQIYSLENEEEIEEIEAVAKKRLEEIRANRKKRKK